ncbi:hypothetical protein C8J57DRAFT_1222143 [Mycena rebaudengoi]|nr:hypothetical protein C8J57DRAFT_1222143 [Mycena rebaudengoi]
MIHRGFPALSMPQICVATMSTISIPGPVPLAFPRPASPTKSPTMSRFRDNSTNNNNTTNVNNSLTPRSRTNSLFDSPVGGTYLLLRKLSLQFIDYAHRLATPQHPKHRRPQAQRTPVPHTHNIYRPPHALQLHQLAAVEWRAAPLRAAAIPPPSSHRDCTSSNASASGDGNASGGGRTGKAGGERRDEYRRRRYSRNLSSSKGMAYGSVAAESLRALPGFDTTPDNKGITTALSHKRWRPAGLAAYLAGEVGIGEEKLGRIGVIREEKRCTMMIVMPWGGLEPPSFHEKLSGESLSVN